MNNKFRSDADFICKSAIQNVLPDAAVKKALGKFNPKRKVILISVGKAAWQMANAALQVLGSVDTGIVITKYGHVKNTLPNIECYEAGHPIPDENSFNATQKAIDLVSNLSKEDTVLFLISGGGSALFEQPLIPAHELTEITEQLLASGADIVEINTIRKRLSKVKGGKFALLCKPAHVFSIILSDIIGDPLDMIASGPAYPDGSTCEEAVSIINKYNILLSKESSSLMHAETPKSLDNIETYITGSVTELCSAASDACIKLGYKPILLSNSLDCEASEAGKFLGSIAKTHSNKGEKTAFIVGGETVVHLSGNGMGGRNQELALSAAPYISCLDACVFSIGSDGTDGPTDAAGGYVDGDTLNSLESIGINLTHALTNHDSYNALKPINGLIVTGATGTNVNDLSVVLVE